MLEVALEWAGIFKTLLTQGQARQYGTMVLLLSGELNEIGVPREVCAVIYVKARVMRV